MQPLAAVGTMACMLALVGDQVFLAGSPALSCAPEWGAGQRTGLPGAGWLRPL